MKQSSPKIFSFFAGAGFLDLGFENTGHEIVYVNENHAPFLDAYRFSRSKLGYQPPKFGYDSRSVEELKPVDLIDNIKELRVSGASVGFIGGPPCPDFSVGGKNKGKEGENGQLSQVYCDLIYESKPDFFLFENVKGLYRTKKHREFFEKLKSQFENSSYTLHERLINSIEYGAPQDRERIILVGFLNNFLAEKFEWLGQAYPDKSAFEHNWPTTHPFKESSSLAKPKGVPEDLTVQHWFKKNNVKKHPNSAHCFRPRAGLTRFQSVEEGDVCKKSFKRLHRWRYSPTAAYGNNEVHLHPYKARRISVAEALAIQSLPADFELPPTMSLSNMFKTIGNGVPYLASHGLAISILNHLESTNETDRGKLGSGHQKSAA